MEEFFGFLKEYGPYVGLPVVVAGITQAVKVCFAGFFQRHNLGLRLVPLLPIFLGMVGGLLLPDLATVQEKILVGGALGTCSPFIYAMVTKTFASTASVEARKSLGPDAPVEPPAPPPEAVP